MAWALLWIAGILEIAFAVFMKWSEGFTRLIPGLFTSDTSLSDVFFPLTLTADIASGNWVRGLHGCRRGGLRDSRNIVAGRVGRADEDVQHWSHFDRRDRT
jgi:hypothetical protein